MTDTKKIMFLGTGSDVGKSVTATAFCRILKNRGVRTAPFKAQNMSNNSFVTPDGGEIGRAQAAQAEAAGCPPSVDMNPVLLKPGSDLGSQVVVRGKVWQFLSAGDYYGAKDHLRQIVLESFSRLAADYEAIVMEGAGSCAELNLRKNDIVNFDIALAVNAPVVLVADIDRGGVFAQVIGTMDIIAREEQDLVAGFIINKFRGDARLFADGIACIERMTGRPVFGLVPFYRDFAIDREDSMSLAPAAENRPGPVTGRINIAVIHLPHVSNFTDMDALAGEPEVTVTWLKSPRRLADFQAVIIPGSKNVVSDMDCLRRAGWAEALKHYLADTAGMVTGICGGYQMLGQSIEDPLGIEGAPTRTPGLALLDITTRIEAVKQVRLSAGRDRLFQSPVDGYEIHMGRTDLGPGASPFIDLDNGGLDGAAAFDGRVFGAYLHGLFDSGRFRTAFLSSLARRHAIPFDAAVIREDFWQVKSRNYDRLAAHFEAHVDVARILQIMGC
jgi:adenosylcobyric acid synthase